MQAIIPSGGTNGKFPLDDFSGP